MHNYQEPFGFGPQNPSGGSWGTPLPNGHSANGGFGQPYEGSVNFGHPDWRAPSVPQGFGDHNQFGTSSYTVGNTSPQPYIAPQEKSHKGRNTVVATVAAGAALLGVGGVAAYNHYASPATASSEQTPPANPDTNLGAAPMIITVPNLAAEAEAADRGPSAALVNEFQTSLKDSTCDPITAESAATTYHNIFEVDPYKGLSEQELVAQVPLAIADYEKARSAVEFATVPANLDALVADANSGNPTIPISEYQAAIQSELASFGMEARFTYERATSDDDARARNVPLPKAGLEGQEQDQYPLTDAQWNSPAARKALVRVMQNVATTPKKLLQDAMPKIMYFSNSPGIDGEADQQIGAPSEYININVLADEHTTAGGQATTFGHEFGHASQFAFCAKLVDQAWVNQNPVDYMYNGGKNKDPKFTDTLNKEAGNSSGEVVTLTAYGGTNQKEDYAENLSRVFRPAQSDEFYAAGRAGAIPVKKLSLYVAEVKVKYPQVAAYFEQMMRLSQLEATLNPLAIEVGNDYYKTYVEPARKHSEDGTITPEEQKIAFGDGPSEGTPAYELNQRSIQLAAAVQAINTTFAPHG